MHSNCRSQVFYFSLQRQCVITLADEMLPPLFPQLRGP